MELISIECVKHKRLKLNDFEKVTWRPESAYQIIAGKNGSGKTTLLDACAPLPPSKTDYDEGGYEHKVYIHNNRRYELTSTFDKGQHHSFVVDGTELNQGGTLTVQRTLVKQHFNYDQELHDLMLDYTPFTEMSIPKRRDWINRLSNVDSDYALNVYAKIKSAHRDSSGAIKNIKQQLLDAKEGILPSTEIDKLKAKAIHISDRITSLMQHRQPEVPNQSQLDDLIKQVELGIEKQAAALDGIQSDPEYTSKSIGELNRLMSYSQSKIDSITSSLRELEEEHQELETFVADLEKTTNGDVQQIYVRRDQLIGQLNEIRGKLFNVAEPGSLKEVELLYDDILRGNDIFNDLLLSMPANPMENGERKYNKQTLSRAKERHAVLTNLYHTTAHDIMSVGKSLDSLQNDPTTTCPQCGYEWLPGHEHLTTEDLESRLADLRKVSDDTKEELDTITSFIEEMNEWMNAYRQYKTFTGSYPRLADMFNRIEETGELFDNPGGLINVMESGIGNIRMILERYRIEDELEKVNVLIARVDQDNEKGAGQLKSRLGRIEEKHILLNLDREAEETNVVRIRTALNNRETFENIVTDLNRYAVWMEDYYIGMIDREKERLVSSEVRDNQSSLAELENVLRNHYATQKVIENIESNLIRTTQEEEAYRILLDVLSPVNGLIAEQISSFMRYLVNQINGIIKMCWSYPMFIHPCDMEKGEMDYRFSFEVGDSSMSAPDVGRGSKGQKEIINFAFKLVAMTCLSMGDYPLIVDELGSDMDPEHRLNVMNYLKLLVEAGRCGQIFLISHHPDAYLTLTQAEVMTFTPDALPLAIKHNENVRFG